MKKRQQNKSFSETIVLAGLGNPGSAYSETRHNVGFLCVEGVAERENVSFRKPFLTDYQKAEFIKNDTRVVLVKPLTYMNKSGLVLPSLMKHYGVGPENLLIAVDNMDLHPGNLRLKLKGSSAGHNGLKSIISVLGTSDFKRLYIGVGRPASSGNVIDHVLGVPSGDERTSFLRGISRSVDAFYEIIDKGAAGAMNGINGKQA